MKNLNTYLLKAVLLKSSQQYLIKYVKIIPTQCCFSLFSGGPLCLLNPVQCPVPLQSPRNLVMNAELLG